MASLKRSDRSRFCAIISLLIYLPQEDFGALTACETCTDYSGYWSYVVVTRKVFPRFQKEPPFKEIRVSFPQSDVEVLFNYFG